jgi:predicted metal-dependent phosphoesterase TrpH
VTVDFHSHTTESDGSLAPAELVARMQARGVSIFSITDHDTIRAYEKIDISGARVVPGVEINTTYKGADIHILGYHIPVDGSPVGDMMARNREHRRARVDTMVAGLNRIGYPVTVEAVLAESGGGHALGRPHVAKALVRAGMVRDVPAAFRELLTAGGAGYAPSHHVTPIDAIEVVRSSGGIPVLAHPGRVDDLTIVDELVDAGLAGIEVFYPTHSTQQVASFRELAAHHGLVMTAGSDFHDPRYNPRGVGMDVDDADIRPFLDLVA